MLRDKELEFDSGQDDEEIDEDLAFTAEDEKQFSHVFETEEDDTKLDSDLVLEVHRPDEVRPQMSCTVLNSSVQVDVLFGSDDEMEELSGESENSDAVEEV